MFRIDIEDEIFFGFDPLANQTTNRNLDEATRRRGLEVDVRLRPVSWLTVWGNYGFIKARQQASDLAIPLVPEDSYTLGAEVALGGASLNHVYDRGPLRDPSRWLGWPMIASSSPR